MSRTEPAPARATTGSRTSRSLGALTLAALVVGVLGQHLLASGSASTASSLTREPVVHRLRDLVHPDSHGALGPADGVVPDGATVFDDIPAVTRLDSDLLRALRRAASDAAHDGVTVYVNSGWRSPAYQERLLDEAVSSYGSRSAAARWVATAKTSAHVAGEAVDVGRAEAEEWLAAHGAAYGLCRVYRNEPWHFELRPGAVAHGCPAMYADPSADPRTWQ